MKLAFNQGWLWVDTGDAGIEPTEGTTMGGEGINHAAVSDLFTMIFAFWAMHHPEILYNSFGRCLIDQPQTQACAPDLVLYVGEDFPRWQEGQPRLIDLMRSRIPNLVGEISDTTLASDLDEQKHLYAALKIPEYWVIDVRGRRVFAFQLNENGEYKPCTHSMVLPGLAIALLEQTLEKLPESPNTTAAAWFAQQIKVLPNQDSIA